jgi:hypothetical protein
LNKLAERLNKIIFHGKDMIESYQSKVFQRKIFVKTITDLIEHLLSQVMKDEAEVIMNTLSGQAQVETTDDDIFKQPRWQFA